MSLYNSDYGSGSSLSSSSKLSWQDQWSCWNQPSQTMERPAHKSSSSDLISERCTSLEDVMLDFRMNGSDSPYNPDEEWIWGTSAYGLSGMGTGAAGAGAGAYLRQKSWPAPESTPAPRLKRPDPWDFAHSTQISDEGVGLPLPIPEPTSVPAWYLPVPEPLPEPVLEPAPPSTRPWPEMSPEPTPPSARPWPEMSTEPTPPLARPWPEMSPALASLTEEQARVLASLPADVLSLLLRQLTEERRKVYQECRFCKNNGERESYYRSHVLKDGRGRVSCPVLRAFVCGRCGARGDSAHTIKYCPLSTNEERVKSAAMMRSVRMASGRRRGLGTAPSVSGAVDYVVFGEPTPSLAHDTASLATYCHGAAPLDPLWAALEKKLMA